VDLIAPGRIRKSFDTKPDLGKCHAADKQRLERLRCNECQHQWLRLCAAQLGNDVGVKQPSAHKLTFRTGERTPSDPICTSSPSGEACSTSISTCPVISPFRRRNSSTAMT